MIGDTKSDTESNFSSPWSGSNFVWVRLGIRDSVFRIRGRVLKDSIEIHSVELAKYNVGPSDLPSASVRDVSALRRAAS